eukprot:9532846-Alexandrium_andersonii.AAC.1
MEFGGSTMLAPSGVCSGAGANRRRNGSGLPLQFLVAREDGGEGTLGFLVDRQVDLQEARGEA